MTKKKQQLDELEILKQENKKLEQTNRVLRKRLKRLEQFAEEDEDQKIEEEFKEEQPSIKDQDNNKCPECNDFLSVVKIAGRSFKQCNGKPLCKYRTKAVMDD